MSRNEENKLIPPQTRSQPSAGCAKSNKTAFVWTLMTRHTVKVLFCHIRWGRSAALCWKQSHLEDILLSSQSVALSAYVEGDDRQRWDLTAVHQVLKHKFQQHFVLYCICASDV